jgi:hypothetical protein
MMNFPEWLKGFTADHCATDANAAHTQEEVKRKLH